MEMIVTFAQITKSRTVMKMLAEELGIEVVEWEDLKGHRLVERLKKQSSGVIRG